MPRNRTLFLAPAFVLFSAGSAGAQCEGCVPDMSCTVSPAFPTLCPATAPDATAGAYYEVDFTFWMPATFDDPGSGFTVDLLQLTITGVSGLPFGLDFTASEPSGVYYPPENEFGCARVCGTPLTPGVYAVDIDVLAHVSASGFELDVPQTLGTSITVLPGSGGNTSFTYTPTAGCGTVTTSFQALIEASPAPTSYAWSFGNGATSTLADPPDQTYDQAGDFEVFLQTTIGGYVLNEVSITGTNGNWCGDVEEPDIPIVGCTGSPDLYFVLTNSGGGTYTSATVDDVSTAEWTDLGLLLDQAPYSVSIYDEDLISGDDLLGTYNIPANGEGTYFINVSGGTTGVLEISNEPQQTFLDSAMVTVFPLPIVTLDQNGTTGELCASGQGIISYTWLLEGIEVPEATEACFMPTGPGLWQVIGVNGFGCVDTSDAVVVCPSFEIVQNGNVLFVPSGYTSYAWTLDGAPIAGNEPFIFLQGDGTYGVTVDAGNGCIITDDLVWSTIGIDEVQASATRLEIFPVPNDGRFTVVAEGLHAPDVTVDVLDPTGRIVHQQRVRITDGRLREEMFLPLPPGAYAVHIVDHRARHSVRFMVR